ncbi:Predicted methyltransferase, contains TPR repeat [Cohaesibacter sp. ES.047]|uniref:class I SAM-dependent DNA methyltransferase n=1 Tax=Cohaesibacter sp. ES.047 TaxID=1798205 RepID=UPI000BB681F3|nr:methyltransferase domain-containing protein [Cohaesibacter sp. ES.047]SNY92047.1 Predicted methyltransferase, contains TPR repeat [Cohaesibacter sp. ES.047]
MSELNTEALAEAYNRALKLEKAGNLDEAAAAYREALALDPDDHTGAAIRLASIERGPSPEKASVAYVATLFDQHASAFEKILVDDLGYAVPMMVREMIVGYQPERQFARMLDLGCGTGLTGISMSGKVDEMIGVDISTGMLDEAYDKDVYSELYAGDVVEFLRDIEDDGSDQQGGWDLIVSTDVLPYLGDLEEKFHHVGRCLDTGGLFAFSSETMPDAFGDADYKVGPKQRFAHSERYVRRLLTANGMDVKHFQAIVVRTDEGNPIYGHLVLAEKRAG